MCKNVHTGGTGKLASSNFFPPVMICLKLNISQLLRSLKTSYTTIIILNFPFSTFKKS